MNHMTQGYQDEPTPLIECPDCWGEGNTNGDKCDKCDGHGEIEDIPTDY